MHLCSSYAQVTETEVVQVEAAPSTSILDVAGAKSLFEKLLVLKRWGEQNRGTDLETTRLSCMYDVCPTAIAWSSRGWSIQPWTCCRADGQNVQKGARLCGWASCPRLRLFTPDY